MTTLAEFASTLDLKLLIVVLVFLVAATVAIALIRAGAVKRIAEFILDLIDWI